MKKTFSFFLSLYLLLLFLFKIVGFYIADIYYSRSKLLTETGSLHMAKTEINKAIDLNHNEAAYLRQRIKINLAELLLDKENRELKYELYDDLDKAEKLNEKNLATHRNIIPFYYYLGYIGDAADLDNVTSYYNFLKNLYHNDLGLLVDIATYERKLGKNSDYSLTVEKIRKLRPDVIEWHSAFK